MQLEDTEVGVRRLNQGQWYGDRRMKDRDQRAAVRVGGSLGGR